MPTDDEVFALRDEERQRKAEERAARMNQRIWDKSAPGKSRLSFRQVMGADHADDEGDGTPAQPPADRHSGKLSLVAAATRERRPEKENMADFISKKREMFLVQMALDTKRAEIRKLEERAQQREEALAKSEAMLEDDVNRFDAFLKKNDTDAVEAMKKAEAQTKLKAERVHEIKKLNTQITQIKSEMSKFEEQLDDCRRYKEFLDELTPEEWLQQQREAKAERRRARRQAERERLEKIAAEEAAAEEAALLEEEARLEAERAPAHRAGRGGGLSGGPRKSGASKLAGAEEGAVVEKVPRVQPRRILDEEIQVEDSGDELPMYFTEPGQLLEIFATLEESNLFLIQNSQETEENLEDLKHKFAQTKRAKEEETAGLRAQIGALKRDIAGEEDKARALTERGTKSTGVEAQDQTLAELNAKVKEVFGRVFGEVDENLRTLQMLTNVETKLEELLAHVSHMPREEVEAAEKAREKERRQRVREEKLEVLRRQQEERIQRSLRRAQEPVQKRIGKQVMARSAPLNRRKRNVEDDSNKLDEEDDVNFYLALT